MMQATGESLIDFHNPERKRKQAQIYAETGRVKEAYKAYAPQMKVAYSFEEAMKEAKGRIFIIDDGSLSCYNRLENKEEYKQVEIKKFEPKYKEYTYQIVVLEKIK